MARLARENLLHPFVGFLAQAMDQMVRLITVVFLAVPQFLIDLVFMKTGVTVDGQQCLKCVTKPLTIFHHQTWALPRRYWLPMVV